MFAPIETTELLQATNLGIAKVLTYQFQRPSSVQFESAKNGFQLQPPHQIGFPLLEAVAPSEQ